MKNIILSFITVFATSSLYAHTIKGTQILKGSLKTEVLVNGKKKTCKVKVESVKNLQYEDSYGNPGYSVKIEASVSDAKMEKDFNFMNIFQVGNKTEARDFEYQSGNGALMTINDEGRIVKVTLPTKTQPITCVF